MTASPRAAFAAALASVAVLTALLTSCAPTPAPETDASRTPTPEPTVSAPAEPRAAFDGDCSAVLTAQEVSEATGETMSVWAASWPDGRDRALGGVTCAWSSEHYLAATVTARVFPVVVMDPEYVPDDPATECDDDPTRCRSAAVFDDVWVEVTVTGDRAAEMTSAIEGLRDGIGARIAAEQAPVPGPRENWWSPVPTCDEIQEGLAGGEITATLTAPGDDRPAIFLGGPLERSCMLAATVDGSDYSTLVTVRAGAGDAVEAVIAADGDARVEHDGHVFATAGEQYAFDGATSVLLGAVGPNLVQLERYDVDGGVQADARVLAAIVGVLD